MKTRLTDSLPDGSRFPEGLEFIAVVWKQEEDCQAQTDQAIEGVGGKRKEILRLLGTALSLMERVATCWWNCAKGDHLIERLVGRVTSSARASLRLIRSGHYDEAFGIIRSIGEIANLLVLFRARSESLNEWRSADRQARLQKFSPGSVRKELIFCGAPQVMNKEVYGTFCEISTHPTPHTTPQSYNEFHVPTLGGYLQEGALLASLNELSYVVAAVCVCSIGLTKLDTEHRKVVFDAGRKLEKSLGGLSLDLLKKVLKHP